MKKHELMGGGGFLTAWAPLKIWRHFFTKNEVSRLYHSFRYTAKKDQIICYFVNKKARNTGKLKNSRFYEGLCRY